MCIRRKLPNYCTVKTLEASRWGNRKRRNTDGTAHGTHAAHAHGHVPERPAGRGAPALPPMLLGLRLRVWMPSFFMLSGRFTCTHTNIHGAHSWHQPRTGLWTYNVFLIYKEDILKTHTYLYTNVYLHAKRGFQTQKHNFVKVIRVILGLTLDPRIQLIYSSTRHSRHI